MTHHRLLLLSFLLLCAGCATRPMISTPFMEASPQSRLPRMAAAHQQALALRSAFAGKAEELVHAQIDLNNGLLGLGITALGLATGKVHRDAYTGVAFLAGAGYSFGQLNLSKPRLSVYLQGVAAVNCAIRAVAPLDVTPATLKQVQQERQQLMSALQELLRSLERFKAQGGADGATVTAARASLLATQTLLAEAGSLETRADSAALALSGALDRIAEQVNALAAGTVADSSAIPQILAGLADIAPRFAPGLGLENAFKPGGNPGAQGLNTGGSKGLKTDAELASLAALEAALDANTQRLETQRKALDEGLRPYRGHTQADALSGCGVSELALALKVDAVALSFSGSGDETQTLRISGGVKPYVVRLRESPAKGVEVRPPLPFDSNVEVFVPAKTAAVERHLLILDRANPPQQVEVLIKVGSSTAAAAPAPSPEDKSAAIKSKLELLQSTQQAIVLPATGHSYKLSKVEAGPPLSLTLSCTAKSGVTGKDAPADLLAALRSASQLTQATTPEDWDKIKLSGASACLKKP